MSNRLGYGGVVVRMTPARRYDAVVDAAIAVMLRKGLAGTTVRDIAAEMGSSSGLIHHYVASMDDLLAAAFEKAAGQDLERTRQAMQGVSSPVDRLVVFFATYTRADEDWAFQLWLDAWAEAARRPAVRATSFRLNVAWQELLRATIADGVAGSVMTCSDPAGAAWRILSLLDGLTLQTVAHRVALDRTSVLRWSTRFAEAELGLPAGALLAEDRART